MRKEYCSKLTKEELKAGGISDIDIVNCIVYGPDGQQKYFTTDNAGYLKFSYYEVDPETGEKIKIAVKRKMQGCKNLVSTYVYKVKTATLSRAIWAWKYGEVPAGFVVDHKNNLHSNIEDYNIDNLQLLTPAENLAKERLKSGRELKCNLNKPISFYMSKLDNYFAVYDQAKKDHNAKLVHLLRSNIYNIRCKIRYYLNHSRDLEEIVSKEFKAGTEYWEVQIICSKIYEQFR